MRAIERLPLEFQQFRQIGGALTFAVFEELVRPRLKVLEGNDI